MKKVRSQKSEVRSFGIILISLMCFISLIFGCKKSIEEQEELAKGYFTAAQSLFKLEDETNRVIVDLNEDKAQKKKWSDAYKEYKKIIEECPDSKYVLDSLIAMIRIKHRYGSYTEYIPLYKKIMQQFPNSPYVKEAEDVIAKLVERIMISADDYAYRDKRDLAIEEYKNVIWIKPDFDSAYYRLGLVYEKTGKPKEAEIEWGKAARLPESHYTLGLAFYSQEKWEKAIDEFNKAIEIKPDYTAAYINLALTYEKFGDKDKAKENWKKYLDIARTSQTESKWIPAAEEHLSK